MTINLKLCWLVAATAAVLTSSPTGARAEAAESADREGRSSDGLIETLVVIGTHTGIESADLASHVSVIDRARIETLNRTSLLQLLDALTGVSINQQGGAGGVTSMYIRGGEANFAVVLIDGVQVNNPVDTRGGSFDFSTLDPSQIERVELIRGPQSAIYGADALSGVLNIVTGDALTSDERQTTFDEMILVALETVAA